MQTSHSYRFLLFFVQLKECQTSVKKCHENYRAAVEDRDPKDITKEFSFRSKLRDLNQAIHEHEQLVERQKEIERNIQQLESNPPR